MRFLFSFPILFLINSCNDTPKKVATDSVPTQQVEVIDTIFNNGIVANDSIPVPTKHLQIGSTGFFIDLPITHKIEEQRGTDFMVYYFSPVDTSIYHGEGGIYFGPKPDKHPPRTDYTQKTVLGNFLGVQTQWTEYTTATYMQTETFIDNGTDQKFMFGFMPTIELKWRGC